jgi:hypothetical protein|nr:MAG TPA: hypothetical protein [Caudoviricetes sp.]
MIGRVNTGGGSGCILTITAVASETVTISKNGKSKSKTADSKGVAVFRGLDTGKWTITIVRGGVPITRVVAVTADYSVAIPLFAATINITYPSGSTCTCSDGTTTLSAPDTSGTWACIVPNAGTWTAAATDGVENTSESVSITTDGQTVAVELSYYTYLFKPNTDTTNVTGGWQLNSKGSLDSAGDQLVATFTNAYNHSSAFNVATINKIDFTEFTTLVATCKAADKSNAAPRSATFAVASTQAGFNAAGTASTKVASTTFSNSTTTVTIDVSGISGSYYVTFVVDLSNYNTGTLTVDEVKLMK